MYATQRKMTLLQRFVYRALLENGLHPISVRELALLTRTYPGSINQLMSRCVKDGIVETYLERSPMSGRGRSSRYYELTEEGAVELVYRLNLPRWPDTKRGRST